MKIGDVARLLGVITQTLRNWANNGDMNAIIGKGGHRRFRINEVKRMMELKNSNNKPKNCVLYCRFSTFIQKENLERQIERLESFVVSNGFMIDGI
ncbi:MAG: recombinase family protein [Promethearchaeota archaeon]